MTPRQYQSRPYLLALCIGLAGLALTLGGCKSYQLGHPAELPYETIFVKPAANESFAPQAQALISSTVRERVIRDGRVKLLADESAADAVLSITLTDFRREAGTRDANDTAVALDYDIILEARVALYDQRSGEYLLEARSFSERTIAYIENPYPVGGIQTESLSQSEYQAMPRIARDMGRKIADEVLSAW